MKRPALFLTFCLAAVQAGEFQQTTYPADDWTEGDPPKEVFVVDGSIKVATKDGNKALVVLADPITDASAQLGASAAGESSIQARIFGSKRGRSYPRFGLSVHGMSGHRLILNAPKRHLELIKNDEVLASVPFTWTSDTWIWMKLEARRAQGEAWEITGKAWAAESEEPAEPMIKHAEKSMKGQGKPGIWGTPFSEHPIYYDDIKAGVETAGQ